jgi:acetyl-CoA carboxylase carboxyltransferase component
MTSPEDRHEPSRAAAELEHLRRIAAAMAMGGEEKLRARRASGSLNARERVTLLLDPGSWQETGLFAVSHLPELRDETPADGKVVGFGTMAGRPVGVIAYDFTVKGASSSFSSNRKAAHVRNAAKQHGFPVIYLGESTGIRMPEILGGRGMGTMSDRTRFLRQRESPWVSGIFGYAFGSAAWHGCASDLAVMHKDAVMSVSSPQLVELATGQRISPQDLGGSALHAEVTGFADAVRDSDEEVLAQIRSWLAYLPSSNARPAPVAAAPAESALIGQNVGRLVPEEPSRTYDMRAVVEDLADPGTCLELKPRYARNIITALARVHGYPVGIIANNPHRKAGAVDAAACDKATSMIVLCDSYNIPLVHLVDQPGFLVGRDAERQGIVGKVINWMNALSLCTVPKLAVILRKSYGQAYVNMGGADMADELAAWSTADINFMDPASAQAIVSRARRDDRRSGTDLTQGDFSRDSSAYELGAVYGAHDVISPGQTRGYLTRMLDLYVGRSQRRGIGQHLLSAWPTSFR